MKRFGSNVPIKAKRAVEEYRGRRGFIEDKISERIKFKRSIMKRDSREYSEIDRAYSKYYEKIKARYRTYVKNLFPIPKTRNNSMNNHYPQPVQEEARNSKNVFDSRWHNTYNNPEFRYRAANKGKPNGHEYQQHDEHEGELGPQVALPVINDPIKSNRYEVRNETISNYYPSNNYNHERHHGFEEAPKVNKSSDLTANIYAQLQSQTVRRKRDTDDDVKGKRAFEFCFAF